MAAATATKTRVMTASPYAVYNAALMNGWTIREVSLEFGITPAEAKYAIELAGGRVTAKGKVS